MNNDILIYEASIDDCLQLYDWFNEKDSIKNKLVTNKKISFVEHKKWFEEKLNQSNTFIWIIQDVLGNKIGQIRFQLAKDNFYDVDIYIIKSLRGTGIASNAMKMAQKYSNVYPLRALVKKSNKKSYSFFIRNGFKLISEDENLWQLIFNLT